MKSIYIGDSGVLVQYLQLALNRAGFPVDIDGKFGHETCRALGSFLGRNAGCVVDNSVWEKLMPFLKGYTTYTVAAGDTLWNIANAYGTTIEAILTANPTIIAEQLTIGTQIYVPYAFPLVSEEVPYTSFLTDWIVEGLSIRYPFLITGCIGQSVMGKEVCFVQIGVGERQVCYSASFHANEWITTPILLKFAEEYSAAYAADQPIYGELSRPLYQQYSLFLVPMVNPDGVDLVNNVLNNESYRMRTLKIAADYPQIPYPEGWKANIEGVDTNLQFPAGWEQARKIKFAQGFVSPAPRDYVGEAPLTAPESYNMYEFTQTHNFLLIIAYHTQGEVIYWKYLNYEPENSRRIAEYFGQVSGYAVEETPEASGYAGYKDWFIQTYNRPGYTIEAGLGENPLDMGQFAKIYQDNQYILVSGMTQI